MGSMEVPGERAAEGGGPYGFVYRGISGSGKRSWSIRQPPKPPLKLRRGLETFVKNGGTPCASPVPRPPAGVILLFLFWTVHGPFSLFLLARKRENGGCNAPAIIMAEIPPARKGEYNPPLWGPAKRDSPFRAVSFCCRKAKSHFTHLTTRRVRPKRPIALGITIRLLNISDSSHTRSLDARVPRKINTRAISV